MSIGGRFGSNKRARRITTAFQPTHTAPITSSGSPHGPDKRKKRNQVFAGLLYIRVSCPGTGGVIRFLGNHCQRSLHCHSLFLGIKAHVYLNILLQYASYLITLLINIHNNNNHRSVPANPQCPHNFFCISSGRDEKRKGIGSSLIFYNVGSPD
jgi:hypothetical protein